MKMQFYADLHVYYELIIQYFHFTKIVIHTKPLNQISIILHANRPPKYLRAIVKGRGKKMFSNIALKTHELKLKVIVVVDHANCICLSEWLQYSIKFKINVTY